MRLPALGFHRPAAVAEDVHPLVFPTATVSAGMVWNRMPQPTECQPWRPYRSSSSISLAAVSGVSVRSSPSTMDTSGSRSAEALLGGLPAHAEHLADGVPTVPGRAGRPDRGAQQAGGLDVGPFGQNDEVEIGRGIGGDSMGDIRIGGRDRLRQQLVQVRFRVGHRCSSVGGRSRAVGNVVAVNAPMAMRAIIIKGRGGEILNIEERGETSPRPD